MNRYLLPALAAVVSLGAASLWASAAPAQQMHMHAAAAACTGNDIACAKVATPAFAPDGSLWLAWAAGGKVMVVRSTDLGKTFGAAVAVNAEPAKLDSGPDARPKIVVDSGGAIDIAYAVFQDEHYDGRVYFSRSEDQGAHFAAAQPITGDTTSQRFETLALDPGGGLFAAWLDKRDAAAARRQGQTYPGAALAYAWAGPDGGSFSPARIAVDDTCECCRLAVAFAGPHRPVVLFRDIFDKTTRDHAVVTFTDAETPGPVSRVSVDDWKTNVCPHQGPTLAIGRDGTYHAAWFTDGQARKGLFYARSRDGGATFTTPMAVGSFERHAARPYLWTEGEKVWLVWKEFDGENTAVKLIASGDDGATWSAPATIASTADASDHPLLIARRGVVYLSWLTRREGYRLMPLEDPE
ncbi:MAG TPA: sialidase family protein [Stellaceae bacterium]|nr:sialidase family protein [Stellaceae bacterium]